MPPAMAARFTTGELAVLRIVVDEVRGRGLCDRSFPEIAARAGVCRTTAQNAIRQAAREGLLTVQRRPRPGRKNLANVVRIVSREWVTWMERGRAKSFTVKDLLAGENRNGSGPAEGVGSKNSTPRSQGIERGLRDGRPGRFHGRTNNRR
jgi:hypothetical protein